MADGAIIKNSRIPAAVFERIVIIVFYRLAKISFLFITSVDPIPMFFKAS